MAGIIQEIAGDVPIDFWIEVFNLFRAAGQEEAFDEFVTDKIDPQNLEFIKNAESLGPVSPTTTLAADQFQNAKTTAAGLSNQATTDVNRRFDQTGAAGQASLASRGLGGSTLGSSVAYANERNRSDELRRVNDDRIQTLLGVEETFGGRQIDANEFAEEQRRLALENQINVAPGGSRDIATLSSKPRD